MNRLFKFPGKFFLYNCLVWALLFIGTFVFTFMDRAHPANVCLALFMFDSLWLMALLIILCLML